MRPGGETEYIMSSIYYPLLSQLFLVVPGPPLLSFLHSLVHLLSILFHHLQPTLQPEVTHAYHNGERMPDNSLTKIQEAHFHTESTVRQLAHRGQGGSFSHRIYCQATCSQRSRRPIFTQNLLSFSHRIYCQATYRDQGGTESTVTATEECWNAAGYLIWTDFSDTSLRNSQSA